MDIMRELRYRLGRGKADVAATASLLPFIPAWVRESWTDYTIDTLVNEGYRNTAAYACLHVHATSFPEPEMRVFERSDGGDNVEVVDHPARALVEQPNAFMSEAEFWEYWITYAGIGGNAYAWIERDSPGGPPVALWPMHDGQLAPVPHPRAWISHYVYDPADAAIPVPVSDVIHWRWSVDPRQPQRGLSPLVVAARSLDIDSEVQRYVHAFLYNDAIPRTLVFSQLPIDSAKMKQQWKDTFGGTRRGDVAVIQGSDIKVERLGAGLADLAVEVIHNIPESRIAAAYGGASVGYLAGLNVHLQRSTYSNAREAREAYTEDWRIPTWNKVQRLFTQRLLREFDASAALSLQFDLRGVRALAEDENEKRASVTGSLSAGYMTVNEARAALGLPRVAGGDVFIRAINVVPEQAYIEGEEPPPAPAPEPDSDEPDSDLSALEGELDGTA